MKIGNSALWEISVYPRIVANRQLNHLFKGYKQNIPGLVEEHVIQKTILIATISAELIFQLKRIKRSV